MDGLRVLERAAVAPSDLCLDPAAPFRVTTAPRLSPARQAQVKAALLRGGWRECGDEDRASVAAVLMTTPGAPDWLPFAHAMTDAQWDAFLGAMCARRRALGMTWEQAPWKAWAAVLEAEAARRQTPIRAPALDDEAARRMTECGKLLALLRAAGPAGVKNSDLEQSVVGRRYSARLAELRASGYVIRTDQLSARAFRFVLEGEPGPKQMEMVA